MHIAVEASELGHLAARTALKLANVGASYGCALIRPDMREAALSAARAALDTRYTAHTEPAADGMLRVVITRHVPLAARDDRGMSFWYERDER